jgi:hypothetical protein
MKTYSTATSEGKRYQASEEEYKFLKNKKHTLLSKTQMAKNILAAGVVAVATGFKEVGEIERLERLTTCDYCDLVRRKDNRCAKCWCFIAFKSRLEAWHCPIGKW